MKTTTLINSTKILITILMLSFGLGYAQKCPTSCAVTPSAAQTVCVGTVTNQLTANITLSGGAGTPTKLYQWYYNTSNSNTISGATLISGATANKYTPLSTIAEVGTRYYFCVGYATNNSCGQTNATQSLASGAIAVTVNPLPTDKTVSGTALICSGTSTNISIASTLATETYQLRNNSGNINIGSALSGNGGTLNLSTGNLSSNTTFNVLVKNSTTNCTAQMSVTPSVTINVCNPEINLQGNGNTILTGSTGISVTNNTDFGTTNVLGGSVTKTYTIQNTGLATLNIWSVYSNSSEFTVSSSSPTIAPGATATLTVVFDPNTAGIRNGTISISNDDSDESTYSFDVQGIGNGQEINVKGNGNTILSGNTSISVSDNTDFGTDSGTKTFVIENLGGNTLNISSVYTNSGEFTASTSITSIAPGGTATLTVTFVKSVAGTRTATVSISNDDANESTYSFNVQAIIADKEINLQGNGIDIASGSTTISSSINTDFGSTNVTSGTVTKTYTIQNTGGLDISIWSVYSNSTEFTVTTSVTTIVPGGTATLTVVFDPNTVGTRNGIISISNNDSNEGTYTFAVQGIGTAAVPSNKTVTAVATSVCSGNSTNITVASTLATETYQLRNNSDNSLIGTAVTGNGGTINLPTGNLTSSTTFNVLATITSTGSSAQMTNTPTVTVNPLPTAKTVSGTALICSGTSTNISVSSSLATETYQLRNNSGNALVGSAVTGNGGTVNLNTGNLSSNTTFNVLATITATGCTAQMTNTPSITLDPVSVGGSVTGGTTICSGNTSGVLTLTGHTGSIVSWESAVSPFTTWTTIANTTTTFTSGALTQTTQFKAVVKSGSCANANSNVTTVTVNPASVGGSVTGGTTICSGNTSGVLTLAGHTGSIVRWESSISPFTTWTTIANTTTTYTSGALTQTTQFRAVVQNGSCAIANSNVTTVTVNPASIGGSVTGGTSICSGNPSGVLTLAGHTGTIVRWESAVSPFTTWTTIANTATTYTSGNLTQDTQFRAVVQNGSCANANSAATTVTVNPLPLNRTTAAPIYNICTGSTGNITVSSSVNTTTSYQLRNNSDNSNIGTAVIGNGGTINLSTGILTSTTTFNVLATIISTGCSTQMSTTPIINVYPLPTDKVVSVLNPTICSGTATNITVDGSIIGETYQLRNNSNNSLIGSPIAGNGGTINLPTGNLSSTTTFNVLAKASICTFQLTNTPTVTIIPIPVNKTIAATTGSICNGKSTTITVASSLNTTTYQLRNNSDNSLIGTPITGNGGTINLPTGNLNNTTTFNVLATLVSSGCSIQMSITPTVTVNTCLPEINLVGNTISILDEDITPSTTDLTDFGPVSIINETYTVTYTIENKGIGDLVIGAITFSGVDASNFTVLNPPASTVIPGSNTTFDVIFNPTVIGVKTATISIVSNDTDESIYNFDIIGTGIFVDTDGDGVADNVDIDDDNDGILDTTETGTCVSDPFVNGSFENTLPLLPATSYIITPDANVPGWQSTEGKIEIWSTGFNGVPSAIGNQFAELNANIPGTLYQTFCLNGAPGSTVKWSIKHRGRSGVDQAFVKFGKTLADAQASTPIVTMVDDKTAWGTYTGVYTIPAGQTQIVLTFQSGYTASGSPSIGNFIDDVQITITQAAIDTDKDGIVNILDLDDENDGIPDIEEAGFKNYSNNTSTMDKAGASWVDANGNGMNDYIDSLITAGSYNISDTDGDGLPNYLDLDSDNDSMFDVDEAGLLNGDGDINGDGKGDLVDKDKDGILDLYDNSNVFGTLTRPYAQDTDSNGISDYLQLDSNSDGINDIKTGLYGSFDANNDGKIDGSGDIDKDGITDTFDTNTAAWGSPRDLNRKLFLDFDGRNDYGQGTGVLGGLASATIMAWIDLNSGFSNEGVILGQSNFNIRVTSSKILEAEVNGTTISYTAQPLNTSQWIHVGAVYGNGFLKLFINGKMVQSIALSGNINTDVTLLTIGKDPSSKTKFFKGKIDEVRVFDVALSDEQFQRMVYQEIQDSNSQVKGTIIPREIGSLPFSNVLRYYRMDVYKDDIIDDLSTPAIDSGTGMKIYNHKVIDVQQAPLPFVTSKVGDFASAVDNPSRDIRGLDVIDYDYSIIQVKHNITESSNASDIGMVVDPGVTITMINDTKILNDWYLKLDGKIDLVDKSQLIQTKFSELDATSIGYIERDQKGQSSKYNYNYWSSPVGAINATSNNNPFTVDGVMKDGTDPSNIKNITWITGYDGAPTSPITLSSYWIFKFQNLTPLYANWAAVGQNGTLLPGQGYTMKSSGASTPNQNFTFVGKPNNGKITSPIAANNLNLSGNPYPSALDATAFILDNSTSTTGTLYFWEHFSTNNTHVLKDYQGGYAVRNLVGGTPPVAPAGISGLGTSTRIPERFIPVGQGFLVYGSATGGDIVFDNNQRAFIKETNVDSNEMFKQNSNSIVASNKNNNSEDVITENNFEKIRLGFDSFNNYHRQVLIGFMNEFATSKIDAGYDAPNIDKQPNDMYFINNGSNLVIQGEGYFDTNNIYPLGIKTNVTGNISFTLDATENFNNEQEIYIFDNVTNLYHDIRNEKFEINLPIGTFDDRFSLRFVNTNKSLAVNEFDLDKNILVAFTTNNNMINVKNNLLDTTVKSVLLFNMLGQSINSWNVNDENQSNIQIPVKNLSAGTYIVKITTSNGDISKKVIVK